MRVVTQTVLAIEHDQSLNVDWNLIHQRLELEAADVGDASERVGETIDVISIRTRDGHEGGGAVADVQSPLDGLGQMHPVELGEDRYAVIGTVRHDRYASTHVAVDTASGRHQGRVLTNAAYEVDFFVCLAADEPVSLHADISGMDYSFPITWPA